MQIMESNIFIPQKQCTQAISELMASTNQQTKVLT